MGVLAILLPIAFSALGQIYSALAASGKVPNTLSGAQIDAYVQAADALISKVTGVVSALQSGSTAYDSWTADDFKSHLLPPDWDNLPKV